MIPSAPSVPRLPVCTVIACLRSQAVQLIFEASNLVEQHHRQRESVTVQRQVLAQLIRALQRHHAADVKDEWIALRRYWFEYAVVQQPLDVGVTEARQLRHLRHRQRCRVSDEFMPFRLWPADGCSVHRPYDARSRHRASVRQRT